MNPQKIVETATVIGKAAASQHRNENNRGLGPRSRNWMTREQERQEAAKTTAGILAALLALFFMVKWSVSSWNFCRSRTTFLGKMLAFFFCFIPCSIPLIITISFFAFAVFSPMIGEKNVQAVGEVLVDRKVETHKVTKFEKLATEHKRQYPQKKASPDVKTVKAEVHDEIRAVSSVKIPEFQRTEKNEVTTPVVTARSPVDNSKVRELQHLKTRQQKMRSRYNYLNINIRNFSREDVYNASQEMRRLLGELGKIEMKIWRLEHGQSIK